MTMNPDSDSDPDSPADSGPADLSDGEEMESLSDTEGDLQEFFGSDEQPGTQGLNLSEDAGDEDPSPASDDSDPKPSGSDE